MTSVPWLLSLGEDTLKLWDHRNLATVSTHKCPTSVTSMQAVSWSSKADCIAVTGQSRDKSFSVFSLDIGKKGLVGSSFVDIFNEVPRTPKSSNPSNTFTITKVRLISFAHIKFSRVYLLPPGFKSSSNVLQCRIKPGVCTFRWTSRHLQSKIQLRSENSTLNCVVPPNQRHDLLRWRYHPSCWRRPRKGGDLDLGRHGRLSAFHHRHKTEGRLEIALLRSLLYLRKLYPGRSATKFHQTRCLFWMWELNLISLLHVTSLNVHLSTGRTDDVMR